ncbi:TPA: hypothetical protein ACHKHF_003699 [Escherichia coli]
MCLHGDLQRFGRRLSLYVNTAAEAIRALSLQLPVSISNRAMIIIFISAV